MTHAKGFAPLRGGLSRGDFLLQKGAHGAGISVERLLDQSVEVAAGSKEIDALQHERIRWHRAQLAIKLGTTLDQVGMPPGYAPPAEFSDLTLLATSSGGIGWENPVNSVINA